MKNLIFVGVIALTTLIACQSENNEVIASTSKTEEMAAKPSTTGRELTDEENAINIVKFAIVNPDVLSRPTPDPIAPLIDCHSPYDNNFGMACVWSRGYLFKVTWIPSGVPGEHSYSAERVDFCQCNFN